MKRLTIDETWVECLKMWKWISRQCKGKSVQWCVANVQKLKKRWLRDNRHPYYVMSHGCFFCEYDEQNRHENCGCSACPAREFSPSYHCTTKKRSYQNNPVAFYAELKRLNKIRLERKSK